MIIDSREDWETIEREREREREREQSMIELLPEEPTFVAAQISFTINSRDFRKSRQTKA
jgi:hypothetical protein